MYFIFLHKQHNSKKKLKRLIYLVQLVCKNIFLTYRSNKSWRYRQLVNFVWMIFRHLKNAFFMQDDSQTRLRRLKYIEWGFVGKADLKICSKFTGERPCRSVTSINLQSNLIEITLWQGFSPVILLHILRTLYYKNLSGGLLL